MHNVVHVQARSGTLKSFILKNIPTEQWNSPIDDRGAYLIQFACLYDDTAVVAMLINAKVNINVVQVPYTDTRPIQLAIARANHRSLELLCAAGVSFDCRTSDNLNPLELAYDNSKLCAKVLIANGMRISTEAPLDLIPFQKGVLKCRSAVIVMISRKRIAKLWNVDKYLLAHMAHCIWATRYDENW